jgi:hypothetical protein
MFSKRVPNGAPANIPEITETVPFGRLFQEPALMFAFKGSGAIVRFRHGGWGRLGGAHCRRQDLKTPVEQALMRGLVTA